MLWMDYAIMLSHNFIHSLNCSFRKHPFAVANLFQIDSNNLSSIPIEFVMNQVTKFAQTASSLPKAKNHRDNTNQRHVKLNKPQRSHIFTIDSFEEIESILPSATELMEELSGDTQQRNAEVKRRKSPSRDALDELLEMLEKDLTSSCGTGFIATKC